MTTWLAAPAGALRRAIPAAAAAVALAGPAPALDLGAMSDVERAAFGAAVRAYLLENPEVLLEAVEVLNARQAAEQAGADSALVAAHRDEIFADGFSWVGGNPDGDVTLVEFLDYRCGVCRRAHPDVKELVRSDGNIRYIVKEFPILGPQSDLSSAFAIATLLEAGPEAYGAMHEALMALEGNATGPTLVRLAQALDLDGEAILARTADPEVERRIAATRDLAIRLQINGTPTFVFDDRMVRGQVPLATMRNLVAELRTD